MVACRWGLGVTEQPPLSQGEPHPRPEEEFWDIYRKVPRLTVEVLMAGEAGVLLTRRAIEPCRGLWHIPGGTVRFGEPLAGAVTRIARRELGISVEESRMLGCIEYPSHYEHGLDCPVGLVFLVIRHSGTIQVNAEAGDHGWFRRLPAEMHEEQVRFLETMGLADPPPENAESAGTNSRRIDGGH